MTNDLFINKAKWLTFNEKELNDYVQNVFDYYRSKGFPYFDLDKEKIHTDFNNLKNIDTTLLLKDNDILSQYMHGLNIVNFYMPHIFEVKTNKFRSPLIAYESDDLLMKAIWKRIKYGDNISDSAMRKALSYVSGTHRVSNFRPTIAKYIYDTYSLDGNILDFSAGFGGRLLGALSSDKVKSYTATEPSTKSYDALLNIVNDLNTDKQINIIKSPFEDAKFNDKQFDLIFSSPPYYNTEEYSYEDTQSFMRYKTKDEWKNNFLKVLIENSYKYCKDNGYFIINIANVSTYKTLESETIEFANNIGFKHIKTYKMSLSSLMGKGFKYEPIFVFRK